MKHKFLNRAIASVAVVLLSAIYVATAQTIAVTGKVVCDGKGVAGVVITDGVNVVKTNEAGEYALSADASLSKFVSLSIPGGYEVECKGIMPQFFGRLDPSATSQNFDFNLKRVDQSKYAIVVISDSHVTGPLNRRSCHLDRELYTTQLIPAINEYVTKQSVPTYMLSCGDMTQAGYRPNERNNGNGYSLEDYLADTKVAVPLFNAMGNHDHNNSPKGTVLTDSTINYSRIDYNKACGPEYYSINIGRDHYLFLDNTFVLTQESSSTRKEGATFGYQERLDNQQQAWVEKDMAALDKSQIDRVVVIAHCQFLNSIGGLQMMRASKFMKALKGYDVVMITGHAHCDRTVKAEYNGNTVIEYINPSTAGTAWYTPWNTDGTPGGAVAYKFEAGNKMHEREFVTYGALKDCKYLAYDNVKHKWNYRITQTSGSGWSYQHDLQISHYKDMPAILVNIWNAYTIDFEESTGGVGVVAKNVYDLNYRDWYWKQYERSLNNEVPEGQVLRKAGWQTPSRGGDNIVRYVPADPKAVVTVRGRDVFGRVIVEFTAQAAE